MKTRVLESGTCDITQGYYFYSSDNKHLAVDIVKSGSKLDYIVAHSSGKIIFYQDGYGLMQGSKGNLSYGNCVKIDHGNGYCTLYAHMQKGLLVKNGQWVQKGQRLGFMSNSGNTRGAHLHFEVWKNGVRINPTEYLDKDLVSANNEAINKSIDELAKEVIAGKYGNGEARKQALGSRYREVQNRVNQIILGSNDKTKYLSNKNYNGYSIVDALKGIGVDSSFSYRSKLAQINGITNYIGSAEQNTKMLKLLKNGTLKSL